MIFAIVFATCFIAVVAWFLLSGVRVKAYFDLDRATFVLDLFVFGRVHAVKYKAFECNGNFYGQINGRELKQINLKNKSDMSEEKAKTDTDESGKKSLNSGFIVEVDKKIKSASEILELLRNIRLKTLRVYLTIGTGNSMSTSLVVSSLVTIIGMASIMLSDKIKVKNSDIGVYPNYRYENTVLTAEADTGMHMTRLILEAVRAAFKIRKIKKLQSDERGRKKAETVD